MGKHTPGGDRSRACQGGRGGALLAATTAGSETAYRLWAGIEMGNHPVIANYESLSTLTAQMREAAVRGEWDHLIDLEQHAAGLVAAMKQADALVTLDEPARQRKAWLIKNILEHDADIRSRTVAWMASAGAFTGKATAKSNG